MIFVGGRIKVGIKVGVQSTALNRRSLEHYWQVILELSVNSAPTLFSVLRHQELTSGKCIMHAYH